MYLNNLAVAVKHRGKILREKSGCVSLPFGSEYTILIKNLNTLKASVNVSIDGKDVLDNKSLLVYPNSETELEGFMSGTSVRNRFRFIEKTKQISDYRGDRIDDGLIRVEFAFEKERCSPLFTYTYTDYNWMPCRSRCKYRGIDDSFEVTCTSNFVNSSDSFLGSNQCNTDSLGNDEGITVKGSQINQEFNYGSIGELGTKQVVIIKLCGNKINGTFVRKPLTVQTKLKCPTCGKKSRSDLSYCSRCGTFLK